MSLSETAIQSACCELQCAIEEKKTLPMKVDSLKKNIEKRENEIKSLNERSAMLNKKCSSLSRCNNEEFACSRQLKEQLKLKETALAQLKAQNGKKTVLSKNKRPLDENSKKVIHI